MENTNKTGLQRERNSHTMNFRILVFTGALTLLVIFTVWKNGAKSIERAPQTPPIERNDTGSENEMSAVKFTVLPFILAFKHFIVENEK